MARAPLSPLAEGVELASTLPTAEAELPGTAEQLTQVAAASPVPVSKAALQSLGQHLRGAEEEFPQMETQRHWGTLAFPADQSAVCYRGQLLLPVMPEIWLGVEEGARELVPLPVEARARALAGLRLC